MQKLHRVILGLIWSIFAFRAVYAENSGVQMSLANWAQENKIVGAAISINGDSYYYGYSNKSQNTKIDEHTVFGIGSITKTFVSVAILKLESTGKLNINNSITNYLPQYSNLNNVTIKQFMQMTAGFNDTTKTGSISPTQEIDQSYKAYDKSKVGKWQYSNSSYQLLGLLIEKVTHKSLAKNISELITTPLNLKYTYIPNTIQAKQLKEYQNQAIKTSNFNNLYAAGGLVSNTQDLNSFIDHLLIKQDILPKKQYYELTDFIVTPSDYYKFTGLVPPKFGLGLFQWQIPGIGEVISYPGVLADGFTSVYTVHDKMIIIGQSNTYNYNDFTLLWPYKPFMLKLLSAKYN